MSITIAFINGKGGVGKTTVSLLMALAYQQAKYDVVLIDRDPQRSATTFAENMGLRVADAAPDDGGSTVVVIDTPPNIGHPDTRAAVRAADLVVLVTTPSPTDVGATAATAAVLAQERQGGGAVVLFNRVQAANRFAGTVQGIAARLPFPALAHVLYQRTAYQVAQLEGWDALPAATRLDLAQVALEIFGSAAAALRPRDAVAR